MNLRKICWSILFVMGCGEGAPSLESVLPPVEGTPALAVVSSDFSSTSIALLDEDGVVLREDWLTSGTTFPGLVAALSGDVQLPSAQPGDGSIFVIDRFGTDVVSRFDPAVGGVFGQVRTDGDARLPDFSNPDDTAYSSNPQDVLFIDEGSAWVSRFEPNQSPSPAAGDLGNDLIEIDPSTMQRTGRRVDISSMDDVDSGAFARPSQLVRVGNVAVVGLAGLTGDFFAAGPGRVALVSLDDFSVHALDLDGLSNCGQVLAVPGENDLVAIACQGFSTTFSDYDQRIVERRAGTGVVIARIGGVDDAELVTVWRGADHPGAPLPVAGFAVINDTLVAGVHEGGSTFVSDNGTPDDFNDDIYEFFGDVLYVLDLTTGETTPLREADSSFILGTLAFDSETATLYVPEASAGVRRYRLSGDTFDELAVLEVGLDVAAFFGPRHVRIVR